MTNITRHITDRQSNITSRFSIIMLCFSIITLSFLNITFLTGTILGIPISTVSALSYQNSTDVSFTFDPILSISVSPDSITTPTIAPGTTATSNTITVNVSTNTAYGYSLLASVGNNTEYNTSDLIHNDSAIDSTFTSIATNASLPTLDIDNTWGYSTSLDNGSTWSTYHGLPLYSAVGNNTATDNPALLIDTKSPADSKSIDFRIAARASSTQPSGAYSNVINFYAVGKPVPPPTDLTFTAGDHIDTLMVADSSQNWKPFYVTPTSTDRSIVFTAPAEDTKYIITVVPEAGYVLSSDSTNSSYEVAFSTGTLASSTLLTTTYTAGSAGDNITISAAQAGSDSAHPAYTTMQNLTLAQCPAYTDSVHGINVTDSRDNKSYTVAKFGNYCYMLSNLRLDGGTELATSSSHVSSAYTLPADTGSGDWTHDYCQPRMASTNGEYYYNWPAATARTNSTSSTAGCSNDTSNSVGDICPAGWSLPTYQDITPDSLWNSGANPGMLSTSGLINFAGSQSNVGDLGPWWFSTRNDRRPAYILIFGGTDAYRSTGNKDVGLSVRCMRSS